MLEISPKISSKNTPNIVEESFKELKNLEYKPSWERKKNRVED